MAIKIQTIDKFNTISENKRDLPNGEFYYLENLNIGDDNGSAKHIQNTTLAVDSDRSIRSMIVVGAYTYGLGRTAVGNNKDKLWNLTTGVGYSWAGVNLSSRLKPFLLYDYTNNCIYHDHGNAIAKFDIATSDYTSPENWCTITGGLSGGLMWKGYAWGWLGQTLYYIDTSTGNETAMNVIPTGQTIVKMIPLGELCAIICDGVSSDVSNMYIIDGVNSSTFVDIIPMGRGYVVGAETIDGQIFAVMNSINFKTIIIKRLTNNIFITVKIFKGRKNSAGSKLSYLVSKVKRFNNYIYFVVLGTVTGSANDVEYFLMRYGREDINKNYLLSVVKNFDCEPTSTTFTQNTFGSEFEIIDDETMSIICTMDMQQATGSMKTSTSNGLFTAQAGVLETGIITGDSHINKKFIGFTTTCEPITTGQSIVIKSKVNADTSWTTLATINTADTISKETMNIESTGANLPDFKEIKFRIELLGGAEITSFKIKYEEQGNIL